jgi:hypothetical protein
VSSTCFEQASVHPPEDLSLLFYGIFFVHRCQDIDQTAYTDAWKNIVKLHVQVFLRMNTWLFETCWRHYTWIKSLMKKVCILLVLITYMYHNAHVTKCKVYCNLLLLSHWIPSVFCSYKVLNLNPSRQLLIEIRKKFKIFMEELCKCCF